MLLFVRVVLRVAFRAAQRIIPSSRVVLVASMLAGGLSAAAHAEHALALGGTPKYGPGFRAFEYVNADAPRGGEVTMSAMGTFDKLNPFTLKGVPPVFLNPLTFESLTIGSLDEPNSMYGLLADDMVLAADRMSITFRLNPAARFSNGDPVLAEDVKYSFDTLRSKLASPMWRQYWQDVARCVVVDRMTVRFEFARRNRELHMIVGAVPVFSRKWGEGKPFDQIVQDPPIASGPYVVEKLALGKGITYRRRSDYWGGDLGSRRGQFNFERIHVTYFLDEFARIEAFKAGVFDFVHENAAKNWARAYYGRKFDDGTLVKTELPNSNAQGMQAFVFNTRRALFADARVRKAIGLALDFEWMNRQLFFNQYRRTYSFFTNSELAARDAPDAAERALLEPYRDQLPAEVFGVPEPPPTTLAPSSLRANLRQARELLAQAGWTYRDGALRNAAGEAFQFEIINDKRTWERIVAPFARNLEKLGIQARLRSMDSSLLKKREDDYDYDVIINWWLSSQSPGNELSFRFTTAAADEKGADNFAGVRSPVVDALIARVLSVDSREELVAACRALDRVLRAGYYVIPHWYNNTHRVSYKNLFGRPDKVPSYYHSEDWFLAAWWMRAAEAPGRAR
jgi:microcin C transport system substrate-binding protein